MLLLRRVGPILHGICLYRKLGGEIYLPIAHVHSLTSNLSFMTLTLDQSLLTERAKTPDHIEVKHHEAKWLEASERLRKQVVLPFDGDLKLSDLAGAYKQWATLPYFEFNPGRFQDMILIHAWCGQIEIARKLLWESTKIIKTWPQYVKDKFEELDGWENTLSAQIEDPKLIEKTIEENALRFKVENLPVYRLIA